MTSFRQVALSFFVKLTYPDKQNSRLFSTHFLTHRFLYKNKKKKVKRVASYLVLLAPSFVNIEEEEFLSIAVFDLNIQNIGKYSHPPFELFSLLHNGVKGGGVLPCVVDAFLRQY